MTAMAGRGQYQADIGCSTDLAQTYYNQFAQACHDLSYHDMNALSRALDLNIRTIYRWRDGKSFPALIDTMLAVLDWHKAGKPIIVRSQRELAASMRRCRA